MSPRVGAKSTPRPGDDSHATGEKATRKVEVGIDSFAAAFTKDSRAVSPSDRLNDLLDEIEHGRSGRTRRFRSGGTSSCGVPRLISQRYSGSRSRADTSHSIEQRCNSSKRR